jgi:uncharacterized protein
VAAKFVLEKVTGGRFRFRLMSQGRILASSESYTTKRAAQNAIASIKTTAPGAQIDDATQTDAGKGRAVKSRAIRPAKGAGRATKAAKSPAQRTTKAAKRTTKAAKK